MTSHVPHRFPGRRSFITGSLILLLFGLVHMVAVMVQAFDPPTDPKMVDLQEAMKACQFQVGPVTSTAWGMAQILNSGYALLLVGVGITGLLVVRPMAMVGRLRAVTVLNIMLTGSLAVVSLLWLFPPPLLFATLALAAFSASLARQELVRHEGAPGHP